MGVVSEYMLEELFIQRLISIGYEFVELRDYKAVINNFRTQLTKLNADKLIEKKGVADFSDKEFERVMLHIDNKSVYESAKILRDKYVLLLDNGETVYLDFFTPDSSRNIYQVAHQITMKPEMREEVTHSNRYDVTILINGLPLVQIELKKSGVEINEAINQINRYRKDSFKGIFHYIQLFVVSNSDQTKYFCNANERQNGRDINILKSLVFYWTDDKNDRINKLEDFTTDFLRKTFLTDVISKYMVIKTTEEILMVMRPYQIYAVQNAMKRVLEINRDGFVFACTGSGKTLTSFKLAQLLRDERVVDRVIFLIDRKDLDDQTIEEYNSFEKDCVDYSTNTYALVNRLRDSSQKMIVTTIQKMSKAANNEKYRDLFEKLKDQKVIFIIDECHRSQFGKMHADVARRFSNANYIGFTGTPIFKENKGSNAKTTADVFYAGEELDSCLHRYMIKNAIADGNVLKFSVEFQRSILIKNVSDKGLDYEKLNDPEYCRSHNVDINSLYHDDERIRNIAEHIYSNYHKHAHPQGENTYTAMFAVDCIQTLGKYYKEFQRINNSVPEDKKLKIAAIFTYQANEDTGENDEGADESSRDLLEACINDYNNVFKTTFSTETFDSYRKDIQKRLRQKEKPQVDLLIVVNMMLTGFDAKPLNTLYLDKNLVWHSLLQAYSRTNRVDKATKQFGQIISYRDIKKAQDDALRLFSGDGDPNEYLLNSYEYYTEEWRVKVRKLRDVVQTPADAGHLESEDDIRDFIVAFRRVTTILATLKTFTKFDWKDLELELSEEDYQSYKSWYMELYYKLKDNSGPKTPVPVDVDFAIELIRTDKINVVYILNLLKDVNRRDEAEFKRSVDLVLREIERSDNEALRYKRDVMKAFINTRFFEIDQDADIVEEYYKFEADALQMDIERYARELDLEIEVFDKLFHNYSFSNTITNEEIREAIAHKNYGLIKTTKVIKEIKTYIIHLYDKYKAEGK